MGRGSWDDPRARATRGLRRMRGSRQTVLLARRAPTIKRWSLDARSEEQSAYSLWERCGNQKALARANGTSRRASGWAGEKDARSGRPNRSPSRREGQRSFEIKKDSLAVLLLAQRAASEGWGERPGALLARRTRTIRMCSLGQTTRLGASRAGG
jgi:hypothetical protein